MDDEKIHELLRRYRPVRPPATLRARALAASVEVPRSWPWAAAASVLLAATLGLYFTTNREIERIAPAAAVASEEALAAAMGGDDEARQAAQLIVGEKTFRAWLSGGDDEAWTIEDQLNAVK